MVIRTNMKERNLNWFTEESCRRIDAMDEKERVEKLAGVLTAYFQNKLPDPALAIGTAAGVDLELAAKVFHILKGATAPDDATETMNRQADVIAAIFDASIVDPLQMFGFEEMFTFVDMRGSTQTHFDILNITNAITFREQKTGERMPVYGISSTGASVEKMRVSAAIGILDDWFKYQQFWNLNQAAEEARSKYYYKQAYDHYTLLQATTSGINQAYVTSDINTINLACDKILAACVNLGYTLTGNETFILRSNVLYRYRITKALAASFNAPNATLGADQVIFNVIPAFTTVLSATSPSAGYYVGLAGIKSQRGIWQDLIAEQSRDILLLGSDLAYSGVYNAAIGNESQWARCALS